MLLFDRRLVAIAVAAVCLGAQDAGARTRSDVDVAAARTSFSGNYLAGRAAGAQRDVDAAAAFFRAALKTDPRNSELLERAFLLSVAEGEFDESMRLAERVVAADPTNRVAQLALAVRALKTGSYGSARAHLDKSARGPLADLTINLLTAWSWQGAGQTGKALAAIDKLQGADFFGTFREYHGALIADLAGRTAEAKKRYDAALAGDTAALRVSQAAAAFRARAGDKDGAYKALDDFEKAAPRHPLMRELKATIDAGRKPDRPVSDTREGVAEVLYGIGGALSRQGGEDLAIVYLQLALFIEPEQPMALVTLADLYDQLNQFDAAIDAYKRVLPDSPLRRNAEIQSAIDLDRLERTDEAKGQLAKLIASAPDDQEAIVALGNIERGREQFKDAAETYSKAIDLIGKRPAQPASAPVAAEAAPAQADPSAAAAASDKPAAAGAPTRADWSLFYVRGIAYERSKQWAKSEADLKTALELYPDQPLVMNYLGYSWIDQGLNLDEGMKLIQRAVELRPDDGYIVDSLGWAHFKLGKFDDAVRELERAVELRPQDPVMNDHLGDAYWRVGRKLEAGFQWSHARDLKPTDEDLRKIEAKLKDGLPETPPTNAADADDKKGGG